MQNVMEMDQNRLTHKGQKVLTGSTMHGLCAVRVLGLILQGSVVKLCKQKFQLLSLSSAGGVFTK